MARAIPRPGTAPPASSTTNWRLSTTSASPPFSSSSGRLCSSRGTSGIPCQGRGSTVGSIVAYTLGISRVEPLRHHLLFERFLSRERGSVPDIDLDFGHARREEVIQHLYRTYGEAHVGMACTVQTYHLKGAVRDVGKALGIPAPTLEAVARRVRQRLDDTPRPGGHRGGRRGRPRQRRSGSTSSPCASN